jgi:hypothetical protein
MARPVFLQAFCQIEQRRLVGGAAVHAPLFQFPGDYHLRLEPQIEQRPFQSMGRLGKLPGISGDSLFDRRQMAVQGVEEAGQHLGNLLIGKMEGCRQISVNALVESDHRRMLRAKICLTKTQCNYSKNKWVNANRWLWKKINSAANCW